MMIFGDLHQGKSGLVKLLTKRNMVIFNRWHAILDPKGEYDELARQLDVTRFEFRPDGPTRINLLEKLAYEHSGVSRRSQQIITVALTAAEADATIEAAT